MTGRRVVLLAIAAVVVAGLVAGGATGVLQAGVRRGVTAVRGAENPAHTSSPESSRTTGSSTSGHSASPTAPASPTTTQKKTKKPTVHASAKPVMAPAAPKRVDAKKLTARIKRVPKPKHAGRVRTDVLDGATGKGLHSHGPGRPMMPASTNKLLTSAAALQLLGGQHRFRTDVVATKSSHIVLVGGGDPYLTSKISKKDPHRGSLQQLAAATAKKLRAKKITKVRLGYDASRFRGKSWNPRWRTAYHDQVSPVSALWADEGRIGDGSPGPREHNPPKSAARTFAKYLKKHGVKTTRVAKARAGHGHRRIASVKSMPLHVIIERLLRASDNDAAEVVARQVAIAAHKPASFSGAVAAIKHTLIKAHVWRSGARIYDGSGLSRDDRVPPAMFAAILRRAIVGHRPHWRAILAGLPVAGVEGSLAPHYTGEHTKAGRGMVHAKTGTLRGVHSLAGYTYTRDGELLILVLMTNHSKQDFTTPVWLRRLTTAISACGCRR